MVAAFRNRTWIEWAVYATCQLRRLGVATTLVYSSLRGEAALPAVPGPRGPRARLLGRRRGDPERPPRGPRRLDARSGRPRDRTRTSRASTPPRWPPTTSTSRSTRTGRRRRLQGRGRAGRGHARADGRGLRAPPAREPRRAPRVLQRPDRAKPGPPGGRAPAPEVEVLTVEGWTWRPGHMICNLDAPALEYNVDGWLRAIGTWDAAREQRVRPAPALPGGRLSPGDAAHLALLHRVQRSAATRPRARGPVAAFRERKGPAFLLATNVVGDSSILRRNPSSATSGTGCARRSTSSGPAPSGA